MIRHTTITLLMVLALLPELRADESPFAPFLGNYVGEALFELDGVEWKRNLNVAIKPKGKGFSLNWTTTTFKPSGKVTQKGYSVDFLPSDREHIYASAMKTNVFGGRVALDPLKGDPYFWARITDKTLTVFAMLITEDGDYEIQVYDRTLTPTGLDLIFSRIRHGQEPVPIKAVLTRINR